MNGDMDQLQFLFKIDTIEATDELPGDRGPDGNWRPPLARSAIKTLETTNWQRWTARGITSAGTSTGYHNHDQNLYETCSLFYNGETSQFLAVPFDCRNCNVNSYNNHPFWSRLTFQHQPYGPCNGTFLPLSVIGFSEEYHVLASPNAPSWMPQLLPTTFKGHNNGSQYSGRHATSLTGDLSLIIALAAFSGPTDCMVQTIASSFKPPNWRLHQHPDNSTLTLFS